MTNLKAKKAVITLGNIELDCYQMPDGKYFLSMGQIAEAIDTDHRRLAQFRELQLAQTLYPEGFELAGKCTIEGSTASVNTISLTDAPKYWMLSAMQTKNTAAFGLVAACVAEALERRADSAFGIQRSEEARNEFLKSRAEGVLDRRSLTDSIKDYILANGCSGDYVKWIYSNVSKCLNDRVYDASTKEIRLALDLKPSASIRDFVPKKALAQIAFTERMAMVLIDEDGFEPLDAMKQAIKVCHTRMIGYK